MKFFKNYGPFLILIILIMVSLFLNLGLFDKNIFFRIRIPETLTAIVVGFALGFAGALSQILFKNPLSDPYILGISSGSSLGIAIAFLTGIYYLFGQYSIFIFSLVFGLISIFLIFGIYKAVGRKDTVTLLLIGIVYGLMTSSLTSIILTNITREKIHSIIEWLYGTTEFYNIKILILFIIIVLLVLLWTEKKTLILDQMNLSDKKARSLGVDIDKYRVIFFIIIALLVSFTVSISGIIGFLGLISPHIARNIYGSRSKYRIFYSGIYGSNLLLISHIISKNINAFYLPVGMILSIIGGIYFLILLKGKNDLKF